MFTQRQICTLGSILFTNRDGSTLSAASIQSGYVLAANPEHFTKTAEEFCGELADYIEVTQEVCVKRVSESGRTYVELATKLLKNNLKRLII